MAECGAATLFGVLPDGREVHSWRLQGSGGVSCEVLDYGGIVRTLHVPDREGRPDDVVLGFDTLDEYVTRSPYFGALVGRYANRIAGGRCVVDGRPIQLTRNDGNNHLHGGRVGLDRVVWHAEPYRDGDRAGLVFSHRSHDGSEGYPGNLDVQVTCGVTDDNSLSFEYRATSDAATVINLTQHSYFNLAGHASGSVEGHELVIAASRFTPVDAELIPTGELRGVTGTGFDFRAGRRVGEHIDADDEQHGFGKGYDHNWVLDHDGHDAWDVTLCDRGTGRLMRIRTSEPGVQFYSGNVLTTMRGKDGATYRRRGGLCLETQHFPDSPNHPAFPDTVLRPGEVFRSMTTLNFSTVSR